MSSLSAKAHQHSNITAIKLEAPVSNQILCLSSSLLFYAYDLAVFVPVTTKSRKNNSDNFF